MNVNSSVKLSLLSYTISVAMFASNVQVCSTPMNYINISFYVLPLIQFLLTPPKKLGIACNQFPWVIKRFTIILAEPSLKLN